MKKIGLALGGGGARGFAHIPVLEVFDELDIKPSEIAGTSIGAILGALYASGHTASDIAEMILDLFVAPKKSSIKDLFRNSDTFKLMELIDPHLSLKPKGLLKGEKLLSFLYEQMNATTFEELQIPLKVVATDFWAKKQVVFSKGELMPALRASMALPYIFTPVIMNGTTLVDGGHMNNVPHDLLSKKCDLRIAVNISGSLSTPNDKIPNPVEALFHTYEVMMEGMAEEKLAHHPVDIYLQPPLVDIDMLDFHKAESIYKQGLEVKEEFKSKLDHLTKGNLPLLHRFQRKK